MMKAHWSVRGKTRFLLFLFFFNIRFLIFEYVRAHHAYCGVHRWHISIKKNIWTLKKSYTYKLMLIFPFCVKERDKSNEYNSIHTLIISDIKKILTISIFDIIIPAANQSIDLYAVGLSFVFFFLLFCVRSIISLFLLFSL